MNVEKNTVGGRPIFNFIPFFAIVIFGSDDNVYDGSCIIRFAWFNFTITMDFVLRKREREQFVFNSPALWWDSGKLEFRTSIDFRADTAR